MFDLNKALSKKRPVYQQRQLKSQQTNRSFHLQRGAHQSSWSGFLTFFNGNTLKFQKKNKEIVYAW